MTPATRRACLKAVIADTPPRIRAAKIEKYRRDLRRPFSWPNVIARFAFLEIVFSSWEKERVG